MRKEEARAHPTNSYVSKLYLCALRLSHTALRCFSGIEVLLENVGVYMVFGCPLVEIQQDSTAYDSFLCPGFKIRQQKEGRKEKKEIMPSVYA